MRSARYWDIPVRVMHEDKGRHAAHLREVFLQTLSDQIAPYSRIGISLSGGLDSAVMAAGVRHVAGPREVHTFSVGYGSDDRELVNAGRVAEELDTAHHPLVMSPGDLPGILPWMIWHIEEPIGREDVAYLYVAAREAARFVELVVTGFGFDGLFAGLPRHRLADLGIKFPAVRGPLEEFYDVPSGASSRIPSSARHFAEATSAAATSPRPRCWARHRCPHRMETRRMGTSATSQRSSGEKATARPAGTPRCGSIVRPVRVMTCHPRRRGALRRCLGIGGGTGRGSSPRRRGRCARRSWRAGIAALGGGRRSSSRPGTP